MKKNKLLILIGTIVLIGIVSLLAYRAQNRTESDNVVRIGAVLPLTGPLAFVGESARQGMELAIGLKGNNIELIVEDGKSTAKDSIMAYRHLVGQRKVDAMFCVASITAKAIAELHPPMPLYMTIVSDTTIARNNPTWLNLTLNNEQEVNTIIDYFIQCNLKKIAIIYQHDDLGLCTYETLKSRKDIELIAAEEVGNDTQIPSIAVNLCRNKPDAIFIAVVGSMAANVARKIVENEYTGAVASFSGFNTPSVLQQAGDAANGMLVCYTRYDMGDSEDVQEFRKCYEERFDREPDFIAAYAYSLMSIFMTSSQGDNYYQTLFGTLVREKDGTMQFPLKVGRFNNGVLDRIIMER